MFKTITHNNLPSADLSTVGEIPLHHLFPLETVCLSDVPSYIHYNGSLLRTFVSPSMSMISIKGAVKNLPPESAMQIYKSHTPEQDTFFATLSKSIDYTDAIPTSIFPSYRFNPIKNEAGRQNSLIEEAYKSLSTVASLIGYKETAYMQSGLPDLLFDFNYHGERIEAEPPRSNMSFIKIGNRYGTTVSVNNASLLPDVRNILSKLSYLERIVVVVPTELQQKNLKSHFLDNLILIGHLSEKDRSDVSIDTMCRDTDTIIPSFKRALYTDVTFFISANSIHTLNLLFDEFNTVMNDHDISLYCHTNTSRSTYTSMFPGNECYGEKYSLVFEDSLQEIITRAMGL